MVIKRRAQYGTGTKPARRSDGLWVARVEGGYTDTGNRRRIVVSAKTEAACKVKLKELQRELAAGQQRGIDPRKTVKAWAETWLPIHAQKVRPTTYTTDAGTIRKWIIPTLGHRRLSEVSPADLRALRDAITGAGRSTTTAAHAHRVLRKMLRDAFVEGYTIQQRILEVEAPQKAASDREAIPLEHALRILAITDRRPDHARWTAGMLMGIRQGETLGLTWDVLDLDAGVMDISWQLQRLGEGHATPDGWEARHLTGHMWLTRPKTSAGSRQIPMGATLHAALTDTRARWRGNPWGLVWVDDHGEPIKAEDDRATFYAIQAQAGVAHPSGRPWYGHEMRHFAISYLLALGVDRALIQRIVGQSKLVESYVHITIEQLREAVEQSASGLLGVPRQIEG
jgi:site-specific recombinase XerD